MISSATANPILQALLIKFMQDSKEFVGSRLFPLFFSPLQSANYYVFNSSNMLNVPDDITRGPSGPYGRSQMVLSDDTYSCKEYGHEHPVDDRERKKYANWLNLDEAGTKRLARILMVKYEQRCVTKAQTLTPVAPVVLWDDYATSNPILDVQTGREAIHNATGMDPNTMIVPRGVYNKLKEHPVLKDKYKYTQGGVVTEQMLAEAFEIASFFVAGGIQNNANEGQTVNPGQIWGKDVYLALTSSENDMQSPSFGRTFAWTGETGPEGILLESYRADPIRSDIHRGRQDMDEKVQGLEAGFRLANVIS